MKSKEFSGFICDSCGKPFTVEQAEGRAYHATVTLNNMNTVDGDYCTKRCLTRAINNLRL